MAISVFDLFKIGIGPSSSHTLGPMKAALGFAQLLRSEMCLAEVAAMQVELFGSLGATGKGHGSGKAVILGLMGEQPETVAVEQIARMVEQVRCGATLNLLGEHRIPFIYERDLIFHRGKCLPYHPNGLRFSASDSTGRLLLQRDYYSVGGGFVVDDTAADNNRIIKDATQLPFPFTTAKSLLESCQTSGLSISTLMMVNEKTWRDEQRVKEGLLNIWQVMEQSIKRGCETEGVLPGGLKVKRRAPHIYRQLQAQSRSKNGDPLAAMDWVSLYALAVSEENAGGGRIVTAPTNGAAGIIPAVLNYYMRFNGGADKEGAIRFLLTAAAIGILYKENASISGAEVGCQGEVGSACSMAAGALTEVLGGTPEQVENAAEIGMEHNLGLTCDPIGGLVQVPCIERNAMAAIKAISASRMALRGDGKHFVSLDKVIKTMRETGRDMQDKYKETARGGLAVNVIEVPVNIIEC